MLLYFDNSLQNHKFCMENFKNKPLRVQTPNTFFQINEQKLSLAKKRPQSTKLDLQQMFQQSIELTKLQNKLLQQNAKLKKQYSRVQHTKLSRQNLISTVQKAVQEKVHQLPHKNSQHSSWLVFKLNRQIHELKTKIEQKQKTIRGLKLSKQNELLRQKHAQLECLEQIIGWAESENLMDQSDQERVIPQESIKQAVWMEQFLRTQQRQLLQIESLYEQQEREAKRVMQELAEKKIELKNIRQMEEQYHKAQQRYKQEKNKKQSKMAGNKNYIFELQEKRSQQLKKLEELKAKFSQIEDQQNRQIQQLQRKLAQVQLQYERKQTSKKQLVFNLNEQEKTKKVEVWAKHIKYQEVKPIALFLRHILCLKKVSQQQYLSILFEEQKQQYSILEITQKLSQEPFKLQSEYQRQILARYAIEESDRGTFLLNLQTVQSTPIIKSILLKIIGQVKVYQIEQEQQIYERVGQIMSKFHLLIRNSIESKQGSRKFTNKDRLLEAIQSSQLNLDANDSEFVALYLFSFSYDVNRLQLAKLQNFGKIKINWISWTREHRITANLIQSQQRCLMQEERKESCQQRDLKQSQQTNVNVFLVQKNQNQVAYQEQIDAQKNLEL